MRTKILFFFLISISALSFALDIPDYHSLILACPAEPPTSEYIPELRYYTMDRIFEVILKIDKKGRVKNIEARDSTDAKHVKTFNNYLKTMSFKPGTFKGKQKDQYLPVELFVQTNRRVPELTFPLNRQGQIDNRRLYDQALVMNGVELPRLESFPSYYYNFDKKISDSLFYPYALFKLNLDAGGEPTEVELIKTTCMNFTDQIQSAIHWGEYRPLHIRNKPYPSENFLLVSIFPQVNYPTSPLIYKHTDSLAPIDRGRVRLLPDTLSLLSKPLPGNINGGEFVCPNDSVKINGEALIWISIDTLGHALYKRCLNSNARLSKAGRGLVHHLKFFPALDMQGRAQPFEGLIKASFNSTKKVAIEFLWLNI